MTAQGVPGTYNFRDLGGIRTPAGVIQPGRLMRSDALTGLGGHGLAALVGLDVRTAIDLREPVERELDPPAFPDGVTVHHQPVFRQAFTLADSDGLDQLYHRLLEHNGEHLARAVALLAVPGALPSVIFCSAGKDRTGLVTALVLSAVGVPDDVVAEEYARTEAVMTGTFREVLVRRTRAAGFSEQALAVKLGSPASLMREVLARLDREFGGAAAYLGRHGLDPRDIERLNRGLTENHQRNEKD